VSIVRKVLVCAALLIALVFIRSIPARADNVDMTDYNTWWQVAEDPSPPDPTLDYNTYWAEVQAKQEWQDRQN
jgi:hypothetical protein